MKTKNLSIKELAAFIGVSTDTIRRAVRRGEIPAIRVKTALRLDLQKVCTCMQRNAETRFGARSASAPGGGSLPCAARNAPGLVKRGHYPQGSLQEVQGFHGFTLHPHH
jgi:excisionase family DNA binding protein